MPLALILKILATVGVGSSLLKGGLSMWLNQRNFGKQLDLQTRLAEGETSTAKMANEENRRQAQEAMTMLREEKGAQREEGRQSRQMQLLGALMQANAQQQVMATQLTAQATRPVPPTSMVGLLRGW